MHASEPRPKGKGKPRVQHYVLARKRLVVWRSLHGLVEPASCLFSSFLFTRIIILLLLSTPSLLTPRHYCTMSSRTSYHETFLSPKWPRTSHCPSTHEPASPVLASEPLRVSEGAEVQRVRRRTLLVAVLPGSANIIAGESQRRDS